MMMNYVAIIFLSVQLVSSGNDFKVVQVFPSNDPLINEIHSGGSSLASIPIVINTWGGPFIQATQSATQVLISGGSALDAVQNGCTTCEEQQCDGTVGFGGSPDENAETTLDAMIMDGETHDVGAVGCLRRIANAVGVARAVMEHTKHTLLVGDLATEFAQRMGFNAQTLSTPESVEMHWSWKGNNCQPNFWKNVVPNSETSCGPYSPLNNKKKTSEKKPAWAINSKHHDTISMIAIDEEGKIACATSSNGARNKIPGRVGDAPIVGAGCYVQKDVGGAGATGDGDVMVRFLPSLIAVEKLAQGLSPSEAADSAIRRIVDYYPNFSGALVAVSANGEYGAACHGLEDGFFPFSVGTRDNVTEYSAPCI